MNFAVSRLFARFSWAVLLYNIPVILWGAYVRVSFSGDGCGADWPFCAGHVIPQGMARPMAIEFTHRMMTSLDLLLMAALLVCSFRLYARGHAVRRFASWSAVFLMVEALLGAGLVIFRKVAHDQSAGRAVYLSAHLTNTMLLLGCLAATAWLASSGLNRLRLRDLPARYGWALILTLLINVTGALAALGDTLFPSLSLNSGIMQDFSRDSAALLRLRVFHPATAVAGAAYLLHLAVRILRTPSEERVRSAAVRLCIVIALQIVLGAMNIALLAPVTMQMLHLLMADLLWIALLLMIFEVGYGRHNKRVQTDELSTPAFGKHPAIPQPTTSSGIAS